MGHTRKEDADNVSLQEMQLGYVGIYDPSLLEKCNKTCEDYRSEVRKLKKANAELADVRKAVKNFVDAHKLLNVIREFWGLTPEHINSSALIGAAVGFSKPQVTPQEIQPVASLENEKILSADIEKEAAAQNVLSLIDPALGNNLPANQPERRGNRL